MTTTQKWVIGILVLVLVAGVVVAVSAMGKGDKTPVVIPPGLPSHCNPNRPGYDKNGYQDPFCGDAGVPYSSECDLNKPGYDMNGFPDVKCGFGG